MFYKHRKKHILDSPIIYYFNAECTLLKVHMTQKGIHWKASLSPTPKFCFYFPKANISIGYTRMYTYIYTSMHTHN